MYAIGPMAPRNSFFFCLLMFHASPDTLCARNRSPYPALQVRQMAREKHALARPLPAPSPAPLLPRRKQQKPQDPAGDKTNKKLQTTSKKPRSIAQARTSQPTSGLQANSAYRRPGQASAAATIATAEKRRAVAVAATAHAKHRSRYRRLGDRCYAGLAVNVEHPHAVVPGQPLAVCPELGHAFLENLGFGQEANKRGGGGGHGAGVLESICFDENINTKRLRPGGGGERVG